MMMESMAGAYPNPMDVSMRPVAFEPDEEKSYSLLQK